MPRKRPAPSKEAQATLIADAQENSDSEHRIFQKRAKSTGGRVSTFFQTQAVGTSKSLTEFAFENGEELQDLAAQLPEKHPNEKTQKRRQITSRFGQWYLQWRAGKSLLLYGYGSKHDLLQQLAKSETSDGACLVVHGLTPGLTAKQIHECHPEVQIVVWAAAALKQTKAQHYKSYTKQQLFELMLLDNPHKRVYVVIHNIDGPGLRDMAGQRLLSELAALPNVHLAASADHVNTPLLWDMQTNDRFSWVWHNVTNYQPYIQEVRAARVPQLLAGRSEEASKQSAAVVLASLSHNAREVFRLILDQQLDPSGEQGVSLPKLFQLCRERFLVSNEMLLKSFLVEFQDHELLSTKRAGDGSDLLFVPLGEGALQGILGDLDQMG